MILIAPFIGGRRIFQLLNLKVRRLFAGGVCLRAAFIGGNTARQFLLYLVFLCNGRVSAHFSN